MKIGILNSGGYNTNSIIFALKRIGFDKISIVKSDLGFEKCDKIIIPGVGSASNAMALIKQQNLFEIIKNTKKPVLGICLGMQIMFDFSSEGDISCLGIINDKILKLPQNSMQMGWNKLENGDYHNEFVYFANRFYAKISEYTKSFVEFENIKISATIQRNNFFGCQFHPEKSGKVGEKILKDFVNL